MQNSFALLVCKSPYNTSVSELLRELHWLPVWHRITYKLLLLHIERETASNLDTYRTHSSRISLLEHYARQVMIY